MSAASDQRNAPHGMTHSNDMTQSEIRRACRDRLPEPVRDALGRDMRRLVRDAYREARREATHDIERAYREGHAVGFHAGAASARALDVVFLRELLTLCHPDLHPGRVKSATSATQRLLALLDCQRNQAA